MSAGHTRIPFARLCGAVQSPFAAPPGSVQDVVTVLVDRRIEQPFRPFPPSWPAGCLPTRELARRQTSRQCRQWCRAGRRTADIEYTGLVVFIFPGHQAVPVPRAEEGPDGHRADVDTACLELVGVLPDLREPTHLLI